MSLKTILDNTKKVPSNVPSKQRSFRLTEEIDLQVESMASSLSKAYNIRVTTAHMLRALVIVGLENIMNDPVQEQLQFVNAEVTEEVMDATTDDLEEQYVLSLLQASPEKSSTKEWSPGG